MSELQLLRPISNGQAALWDLFKASIQTAISFLLGFLPNTISIFLLEFQNETLQVGALGLGILVTYGIGMGVLNGMATGLETLVSQAYGANQYELCAKLYYRSLFICHLFMIPVTLILLYSGELLSLINNNKDLTEETGKFSKWMIIAVYFDGIFVNTKAFMNGQNIYNYQLYTQMITCVLFIAICYVLVVVLQV